MPAPEKGVVTKVCIDDFAFRKRKTYGTIMVDIDTHRIIDLLASREVADVAEWLKSYPNLEVVSRDGSVSYKSAIEPAGSHFQQVSDRFHLLKGLTDAAKNFCHVFWQQISFSQRKPPIMMENLRGITGINRSKKTHLLLNTTQMLRRK